MRKLTAVELISAISTVKYTITSLFNVKANAVPTLEFIP